MTRINIETIAHKDQRYPTAGDWWRDGNGILQIRVSEMSDNRYSLLVAIHELVEVLLCEQRGVTEESVTAYDLAHLDDEDPGCNPAAFRRDMEALAAKLEREGL